MSQSSSRRVALITGGAVRVGRAITEELAAAGFEVVVNYHRSASDAESLVDELRGRGSRAMAIRADITDPAAAHHLVDRVMGECGQLDLLVNNAAIFERRPLLELDDATWQRHLSLNLEAPFRLSTAVARHMCERGCGRIVNICGTVGILPPGDYVPYCVAKSGLDTLTRCMAEALAPTVQVNGVAPGAVLFPEHASAQERERVLARVPAGKEGRPGDVAAAVRFFADAPDYVTGAILPVDGGASLVTG